MIKPGQLEAALRETIPGVEIDTSHSLFGDDLSVKLSLRVGRVTLINDEEFAGNTPEQWADWLLSRKVEFIDLLRQAAQEMELSL